jgi:hypothetical protein
MALNFLPQDAVKSGESGTVAFLTPKREIYRRNLALPAENSHLVWVARPPALELSFEELKKCMTELRRRSHSR